jgi:glycolate oxidase
MYKKLNDKLINKISGIVGKENLFTDISDTESFARDETPGAYYLPEAVIRPETSAQVHELIKLANSEQFPLTPRGGGTGLTGGALPVQGGAVIVFEKLNRIKDIDSENRMAVVEPGVINGVLQKEAEKLNLFYPVNPASMDSCTLGGNLAEASGGANTVRYGTTRNYITGIKAITGSGMKWEAGGKIVKNATDHTLIQLMCGSEGTLAAFTELVFRLVPKPTVTTWIIAPFKDIYKIPETALKLFKMNLNPTMVELMDTKTLTYCSRYLETQIQYSDLNQLIIRFDSDNTDYLDSLISKAGQLCQECDAEDVLLADTKVMQDKLWKMRSSIHDAIHNEAKSVYEDDVVVPVANVSKLVRNVSEISEKIGFVSIIFGHLGDGNMHLNFSLPEGITEMKDPKQLERLREAVFKKTLELGGKLSGEHGIGISKKHYFEKLSDSGYIELMRNIKKEFDPNHILNPGKICY